MDDANQRPPDNEDDDALTRLSRIVRGMTTMVSPGCGFVDLNDLRLVLGHRGQAVFGEGEAEGPDRATVAAERALADLQRHLRRRFDD